MNAGFVSKKREEQLWEVQRIITQLKVSYANHSAIVSFVCVLRHDLYGRYEVGVDDDRSSYYYIHVFTEMPLFFFSFPSTVFVSPQRKLRSFERKQDSMQKSMDDAIGEGDTSLTYDAHLTKTKSICSDDESLKTMTMMSTESNTETKTTPQATPEVAATTISVQLDQKLREQFLSAQTSHDDESNGCDRITVNEDGLLALPESHPDYLNLLRLQLENMELNQWKLQLQRRIQSERAEVVRLKTMLNNQTNANVKLVAATQSSIDHDTDEVIPDDGSYERIITHYVRENTLLEQKKQILAKEIFDENRELIQLQVELAVRKYQI